MEENCPFKVIDCGPVHLCVDEFVSNSGDVVNDQALDVLLFDFVLDVIEHSNPKVMAAEMAFFRELLGPRINNFECCIKEGFDEIDRILLDEEGNIKNELSDQDIMRVHGIRWLMASEGLHELIEQFAPNVLKYLPAFFLFP